MLTNKEISSITDPAVDVGWNRLVLQAEGKYPTWVQDD